MEITFIPQECILLCRKGMHSIERDALEFPKQLNCSSKRFFEERKKKPLIPLLHTSQCCHLRKFRNCWLYSGRHFEAHHSNEPWHWCEQSLSGSAQSNLCEFLHSLLRGGLTELLLCYNCMSWPHLQMTTNKTKKGSSFKAPCRWRHRIKWNDIQPWKLFSSAMSQLLW